VSYPPPGGQPVGSPAFRRRSASNSPPPNAAPVQFASPRRAWAPLPSVVGAPTRATIPLNKLAPEAALRRLELTIVRRLEGFLHGDHLGLLPGPGSTSATLGSMSRARTMYAGLTGRSPLAPPCRTSRHHRRSRAGGVGAARRHSVDELGDGGSDKARPRHCRRSPRSAS
jgi:hypothetical protein